MKKLFKKMICATVAVTFTALTVFPSPSMAQQMFSLPAPGAMIAPSPAFSPVILRGIKIHPGDPFQFDFLIDSGELKLKEEELKTESTRLIKYFLASLTVPEDDLWVNLSPFEKDRIIPNEFGTTEMGRDLLAQDYLLKQLTASLIYPETDLGKKFWDRVYKRAQELYGTTDVAISTFNKVWILPDKAVVNEVGDTAFVSESHLKVMLEEDYLAFSNQPAAVSPLKAEINKLSSQIIRDLIIPEIEKEVNTGKNFARLRQVYNSLILAAWYKRALKESILAQVYADKNKVAGVDLEDKTGKEKIYQQYLEAYKKGVYNFIKEEYDPASEEMKPRKYFSGGFQFGKAMDRAMTVEQPGAALAASRLQGVTGGKLSSVNVVFIPPRSGDRAMPDTKAFKINTYTMDSGARVLTRLAAGRGQFDPAHMLDQDEIVEKEGEAAVFSPDENGKWDEWGSSLMTIEYEYHWGLMREIIDGATADPARTFTVVDWGAGPAKALNEIARELKARGIENVRLVGVSNRYSPEWKSLDPGITMVFDNARNLDRYLEPKSVDLMFSYYGLRHLKPDLDKYLDGLSKIFNDGGKIFFNFSLNQGKLLDQLKGFTVKFLAEEDSVLLKKVPVGAVPDRAMLNQAAFEEYLFKAFQKSRMDAKALEKYVEDLEKHRDLDKNIDGIVTAIGKDYDPDLNKYDRDVIEALGRVAEKLGKAAPSRRGDRAMTGGYNARVQRTDEGLIVRWEVAYDNLPDDQWPALFDSLPVMEAGEAAQKFASGREAVSLLQVRDKVKVFGLEHAEAFAAKHQIGVRIGDLSYRLQDRTIQLIDRQGKVLREFEDADIRRFLALRIHSVISSILVEGPRRDLQRLAKKLRIAKEGVPYQADFTGDTIKIHLGGIDPVIDKRSGAVVPGGVPTLADQAYLLARMALALRNSVFQKTEQGVVRLPSVYGLLTYNPVSDNAMLGEVKKAEQLLNQKRLLLHASRDNDMDQNIISQGVKATRVVPGGGWRGEPGVHLGQNNHDMEAPEGVVQGWRTNTAFYISQKTIFDSDPLQRGRVYVVSGRVRALDSWNAEDPTRREVRMDGPEGAVIIPAAYLTGVIANVRDKDREILRMIEANKFLPLYLIDKIDGKIVLKKALSAKAVQTQTASIRAKNLDKAMMAKPGDVGGIDFNPANLNLEIKRDGKGMPVPFTPQELEQINIPGLVPIIINITPVTNLPLFLGASTEQPIGQLSMK